MVAILNFVSSLALASMVNIALAHPGENHNHVDIRQQISARNHWARHAKRSIDKCASVEQYQELTARSVARRAALTKTIRVERGIETGYIFPNIRIDEIKFFPG